ncbi:AAA family ATPase [Deinococcus frigens]|uniref:AAA family ATPase n=1 Tax=Deinococcus frigens TaxID=249403 RepID=UPI00068C066B|nr:AAA family ATPase [Deinococcus frigens]
MPTLFLLIGLPGAGKTTLARRLELEHSALRLTPDEWMTPLFGAGEADDRRWILESELLWGVAARALTLGMNVILDYGCWAREERALFRTRAAELGVHFELHVLDVPMHELWRRLEARNLNLPPDTFPITRAELEEWAGWYEVSEAEELAATEVPSFVSRVWRWQE